MLTSWPFMRPGSKRGEIWKCRLDSELEVDGPLPKAGAKLKSVPELPSCIGEVDISDEGGGCALSNTPESDEDKGVLSA